MERVREFIWVDSWQQQCCGAPFSVGTTIWWQVRPLDASWLRRVVPDDVAGNVRLREEHHDEDDDPTTCISGLVRSIRAVTHDLRRAADTSPGHYEAAPGSGVVHDVTEADLWEFEPGVRPRARSAELVRPRRRRKTSMRLVAGDPPDTAFAGWIVEVELGPNPAASP